jgi:hypothetical protein
LQLDGSDESSGSRGVPRGSGVDDQEWAAAVEDLNKWAHPSRSDRLLEGEHAPTIAVTARDRGAIACSGESGAVEVDGEPLVALVQLDCVHVLRDKPDLALRGRNDHESSETARNRQLGDTDSM